MKNEESAVKPPNPFNPGSPVDPSHFIGRVQELENFKQKLRQTATGSLASMAIAGGYGVGKTSFLHKCKSIAEEQNAMPIYFSLNEVDQLNREQLGRILMQRVQEKVQQETILGRLSKSVFDVLSTVTVKAAEGLEFSIGQLKSNEFPNLHSALAHAWSVLKKSRTAIVFLIDEARVLERNRADLLLGLRAVLEQLQVEKVPVMIVPAGKLTITGPTGSGFSPLGRTFPPTVLENFSKEESRIFIEKKLAEVKMGIKKEAMEKVYEVTEGHPFVVTAYLASAYLKTLPSEKEITEDHLKATDVEFVSRTLFPFLSRFYDQAGKNSKRVLDIMAKAGKTNVTIRTIADGLKRELNEVSPLLAKLVQDGAIIRVDRGEYRLFHHLLGEYILKK